MNLSFFIARRLYFTPDTNQRVSKLAIHIAAIGVTIGLAVMLLSVFIVMGFKNEINEKMVGFGAHIQILNIEAGSSPESFPIITDSAFCEKVASVEGVKSLQRFSNKLGILKTEDDFKAILFKGIDKDYDTGFLQKHLKEGELPHYKKGAHGNDIAISRAVANEMHLQVGDRVFAYFFEESLKMRRFRIAAIYETHMSQFDNSIAIGNLYTVNQLNGWSDDQSSGIEIVTNNFEHVDDTNLQLLQITRNASDRNGCAYASFTVKDLYSQIFDWLKLLDLNVWVILVLMMCVASFTMISGLLILILERTGTIGTLKAIGSGNGLIRRVFLNYALFILGRGLLWGNLIGLGLGLIQMQFQIVKLNAANYYVDHVPMLIHPGAFLLINLGTLIVCLLTLVAPSYLVSRIQPVKAIRFDA